MIGTDKEYKPRNIKTMCGVDCLTVPLLKCLVRILKCLVRYAGFANISLTPLNPRLRQYYII